MRIFFLAPLGALFFACGNGSYYSNGDEVLDPEGVGRDPYDGLAGDYKSCEDALRDLGEEPWDFEAAGDWGGLHTYLVEPDANPRPWMATISPLENGDYYITCNYIGSDGVTGTRVVEGLDEYWNCAFQYNLLSIHDPESDPGCNQGYEEYADDGVGEHDFVLASPGRFVRDENMEEE